MKKISLSLAVVFLFSSCSNISNSKKDNLIQMKKDSTMKMEEVVEIESIESKKLNYYKSLKLREKYINYKYEYPSSQDFISDYGYPETLIGTDNNKWVVYFPKGDFTVIMNKQTSLFENIYTGNYPSLKYDVTLKLSELIGQRINSKEYNNHVNSIKHGEIEVLSENNCINHDCVEYYQKTNFTTVVRREFEGQDEFITLKKIARGKLPELIDF